jgi:hypothetical protein
MKVQRAHFPGSVREQHLTRPIIELKWLGWPTSKPRNILPSKKHGKVHSDAYEKSPEQLEWPSLITPALRKLRQEDCEFEASLGCIAILCLKNQNKTCPDKWVSGYFPLFFLFHLQEPFIAFYLKIKTEKNHQPSFHEGHLSTLESLSMVSTKSRKLQSTNSGDQQTSRHLHLELLRTIS